MEIFDWTQNDQLFFCRSFVKGKMAEKSMISPEMKQCLFYHRPEFSKSKIIHMVHTKEMRQKSLLLIKTIDHSIARNFEQT